MARVDGTIDRLVGFLGDASARAGEQPFVQADETRDAQTFKDKNAPQTQAEPDRQQKVARNITRRIKPPAAVRFQEFGPRDLTVTPIEHTIDMKKHQARDDARVGATGQKECPD